MKRFGSSDSLGALISISQSKEDMSPRGKQVYSREFQAMLDSLVEEDYLLDETFHNTTERKRRLTMDQVKTLEKNFEVENKLEPERKAQLAEELALQPRQVAIWFQNRRARWKNKQLEKDYGLLKANYDALKLDYTNLEQEREALTAKLQELRAKMKVENAESNSYNKQECPILSEHIKDQENPKKMMMSSPSSSSSLHLSGSSSFHSWVEPIRLANSVSETQLVKIEEQSSLFTAEESCNFFSVDHAPSLQWYFNGQ